MRLPIVMCVIALLKFGCSQTQLSERGVDQFEEVNQLESASPTVVGD